jgi:hypothetical protein
MRWLAEGKAKARIIGRRQLRALAVGAGDGGELRRRPSSRLPSCPASASLSLVHSGSRPSSLSIVPVPRHVPRRDGSQRRRSTPPLARPVATAARPRAARSCNSPGQTSNKRRRCTGRAKARRRRFAPAGTGRRRRRLCRRPSSCPVSTPLLPSIVLVHRPCPVSRPPSRRQPGATALPRRVSLVFRPFRRSLPHPSPLRGRDRKGHPEGNPPLPASFGAWPPRLFLKGRTTAAHALKRGMALRA